MKPLLSLSPTLPARVLWTSTLDTRPADFDLSDWQLIKTPYSYELSKYETELVANRLNAAYRDTTDAKAGGDEGTAINQDIRHFVVHPGVTATNVYSIIGPILDWFMKLAFYIVSFSVSLYTLFPFLRYVN